VANYSGIQKEHQLKNLVFDDYFDGKIFSWEQEVDNIDFIITDKKARSKEQRDFFSEDGATNTAGSSRHYLWAEAKKGTHDVFDMYTQLILTCKKTYEKADHLAPPWLGCFDEARISFVAFHDILPIFKEIDFNWNQTPSNHDTSDFQKSREKIKKLIGAKIVIYNFEADDRDIKEFIKTRFTAEGTALIKSPITKDNFVQIFIKWVKEIKPFINIGKNEWTDFKHKGILDCDFYRADIMSSGGNTITEKLKIVLKNDNYKFQENISGRLFTSDIGFTDSGEAYNRFWNRYERPPAPVFQQHIIDRRDLLVPQNIREIKGTFFTPKIWADKSKEYLAAVFGEKWQDEYYIWDCAAGTGNLLAGLTNKYNLFASDIEQGNVETMQSLIDIDEHLNLLPAHVFQFDFLNDNFDNLPDDLRVIINDPEKRKKLIIYINPPYAESGGGIGTGINKPEVVIQHSSHDLFLPSLGKASHELFSQFMARVFYLLPNAHLAVFSTLKYLNSYNFQQFRNFFRATFKKGFMCKANTFDNVSGEFPIGFLIWEMNNQLFPSKIKLDICNTDGTKGGAKSFYNGFRYINDWFRRIDTVSKDEIAILHSKGIDFQNNQGVWFCINQTRGGGSHFIVTKNNLIETVIYFTVRTMFQHTWINHNDQFLYPHAEWEKDTEFQNNGLIYALLADKNRVSCNNGTNHWIPYSENEVNAKSNFESNFMSDYLKGKVFSPEAQAVLDAGRELWKYYHAKTKNNNTAPVNASLYDIREFFQGRKENGTMNTKSDDETYNTLIKTLREKQKALAKKIEPKIYEYGFLKE
jgi:hypothetical protein